MILCFAVCAAVLLPGLAAAQTGNPVVPVRVGEHAGFNRVVFDWPERVSYRVEVTSLRATMHFERPATLDLSGYRHNPPPLFKSVTPRAESGSLAVEIRIPAGSKLRHFAHGTSVVIDVLAPPIRGEAAAPAVPAATAVTAPATAPAPAPMPAPVPIVTPKAAAPAPAKPPATPVAEAPKP